MLSAQTRYIRLLNKAHGRALDPGRGMAFIFPKYCKHCGKGMKKPNQWDRRELRALFKESFCCAQCRESGPRHEGIFPLKAKPSEINHVGEYPLEELAFVALEMKREEQAMSPMKRLVRQAHQAFNLLSEKLAFLRWKRAKSGMRRSSTIGWGRRNDSGVNINLCNYMPSSCQGKNEKSTMIQKHLTSILFLCHILTRTELRPK